MMVTQPRIIRSTIVAMLAASLLGQAASAQEIGRFARTIKPYAQIAYTFDSNLLRLTGEEEAIELLGDPQLDDSYATYEFGIDALWERGANEFQIVGYGFSNVYNHFSGLDYAGGNVLAQWAWETALWDGDVGYRYSRNLRDFANFPVRPRKDIRTRNAVFGDIGRRIGQSAKLTFRVEAAEIFYSDQNSLDQNRIEYGAALDFFSRSGNSVGLDAEFVDGTFDLNPNNDYELVNVGPTVNWEATGKSKLKAKAGYTNRTHNNSPERDFDGFTFDIQADWQFGGNSKTNVAVYREVSNLGDEIANFAVIYGVRIEPRWQVSARTAVRVQFIYEDRNFQGSPFEGGDPVPVPPLPDEDRVDKVTTGGAWLEWTTEGAWTFGLGVKGEDRSSSNDDFDYDFVALDGHVRFGF